MAQSIKLGNDTYLDWTGVTVNNSGKTLSSALGSTSGNGTIFKVATKSSATFNVSAYAMSFAEIDVSESGYTAIGIVALSGSGTSGMSYSDWYFNSGTTVRIYYRENAGTAKTGVKFNVQILYIKS